MRAAGPARAPDAQGPAWLSTRADAAVGRLQHGDIEAFLAAEIVIDHALAGLGAGGNIVDPRTAEALAGKLLGRNFDDVALGSFGVIDALSRRAWLSASFARALGKSLVDAAASTLSRRICPLSRHTNVSSRRGLRTRMASISSSL